MNGQNISIPTGRSQGLFILIIGKERGNPLEMIPDAPCFSIL
jgi:hypothetical protein